MLSLRTSEGLQLSCLVNNHQFVHSSENEWNISGELGMEDTSQFPTGKLTGGCNRRGPSSW